MRAKLSGYKVIAIVLFIALIFAAKTSISIDERSGNLRIEDPQHALLNYQFSLEHGLQHYLDLDKVHLIVDEAGKPISNKITDDDSLGTVHTFDIFPVLVSAPTRSTEDGLWRVTAWVSSGSRPESFGYLVTFVLGSDDTVIEYDFLASYVFEYRSGHTQKISNVIADLTPGEQVFMHIIGSHSFTQADMDAIEALGFDYPQLILGHEETNMAMLKALKMGQPPPAGEIRGLGLIYRGQEH